MKKIIILVICLMCVLTACKPLSESSDTQSGSVSDNTENNTTISNGQNADILSTVVNTDTTYIEIDPNASIEYNAAITAYNAFLSGKITAKSEDGTFYNVLQYDTHGNGIANFALGDVNNDNIPELFIHGDHYTILAFDGEHMVEWYVSTSWQRIYLLENGSVLDMHSSVGAVYNYITFDADGIERIVYFGKSAEGEPIQTFYFGENGSSKNVSKEEWDRLTKPYFEQIEKKAELNWIEWKP